jgi:hypothetical protein
VSTVAPDGAKTLRGAWKYTASLVAYQQRNSPAWYIAWAPDVLAPNLTASTHLAAVMVAPQVASVTDASGGWATRIVSSAGASASVATPGRFT